MKRGRRCFGETRGSNLSSSSTHADHVERSLPVESFATLAATLNRKPENGPRPARSPPIHALYQLLRRNLQPGDNCHAT
jgi:hypothetical protein